MIPTGIIPIGDDDSRLRRRHYVTPLLILVNVLVFVYQLTLGDAELWLFINRYGTIPWEIVHLEDLAPTIRLPVLATLVTSMFLHGGFLHIAFNMLFLWVFGDNIEDVMGHGRFLVFYLLCGVIAALSQVLTNTDSLVPIVGASGAISGVMAAYLALFPRGAIRVATIFIVIPLVFRAPAFLVVGLWAVIQFLSGFMSLGTARVESGTAFFSHIGGFLAGLVLVWFFADRQAARRMRSWGRS